MTQVSNIGLDRLRLIQSQDCRVGDWVHNTTEDCELHGYWHKCIGVRVGSRMVGIWLETDDVVPTEVFHVEIDESIVVASADPRPGLDRV